MNRALLFGIAIFFAVVGILAYLLLGEARISAKRRARYAAIEAHLPHPHERAQVRRVHRACIVVISPAQWLSWLPAQRSL